MRDKWLILLAIAALLAGFLVQKLGVFSGDAADVTLQSDCNLRKQACEVAIPGKGKISLDLLPRDFRALSVMKITLTSSLNQPLAKARMQFEGINMDMGINFVNLHKTSEQNTHFTAEAMLPACTSEKMIWLFHLYLELDGRKLDIQFPVEI